MLKKSVLVVCTTVLAVFAADVDFHGVIKTEVGTDLPVEKFDPSHFAENDLKVIGDVQLNDGVSVSITYRNFSQTGVDRTDKGTIDREYRDIFVSGESKNGVMTQRLISREVDKNSIPLQVLAKWNFVKNGTFLLGDYTFSAGQPNLHRLNDTLEYGSIFREHSLRGFGVQASGGTFFVGMIESIPNSMGMNASYDVQIINKPKTKFAVKPVIDWVMVGDGTMEAAPVSHVNLSSLNSIDTLKIYEVGRSREWNLGVEGVYASYLNNIEYSLSGALGILPYAGENTYTFLVEPTVNIDAFTLSSGMYWAWFAHDDKPAISQTDIPEEWFAYVEPTFELHPKVTIGMLYEYHDISFLKANDVAHVFTPAFYIYPNDALEIWAMSGIKLNESFNEGFFSMTMKSVLRF